MPEMKTEQNGTNFTGVTAIKFRAYSVDEWACVRADVTLEGFDRKAYENAIAAESKAFFDTQKRIHVGMWKAEAELFTKVTTLVLASPEWRQYYSTTRYVWAEEHDGGDEVRKPVPRPTAPHHFDQMDVYEHSISVMASDR